MKKGVIALISIGAILLLIGILVSLNYIVIRLQSKKYDLIDMDPVADRGVEPDEEGYEQLSEMTMHYLKFGHGEKALILIHGNGGSAYSLTNIAGYFADKYTVYCVADRCQGKSSDPGVISYELMAK
ncbi:MAG: alpha/beta hydrolase, partial [Clostridia bacterium]|nr:alpha/beta hydrolase [Clostridia bacterium]